MAEKTKAAAKSNGTAKKAKTVALPDWQSPEAEKMMKRKTDAFLTKHGTTDILVDLQALLALSTKLTGYRRPCQLIVAYKPPVVEEEDVDAETETEEEEDEEEE